MEGEPTGAQLVKIEACSVVGLFRAELTTRLYLLELRRISKSLTGNCLMIEPIGAPSC